MKILLGHHFNLQTNMKVLMVELASRSRVYRKKCRQYLLNVVIARRKKIAIQKNMFKQQQQRKVWVRVSLQNIFVVRT